MRYSSWPRSQLAKAGLLPDAIGWDSEKIGRDLDAVILGIHARKDNPDSSVHWKWEF
jgi:UDP-N-acetylmuramate: L-alanyl-gamma-D-glutamyl-meso-diaminopimelate ligase